MDFTPILDALLSALLTAFIGLRWFYQYTHTVFAIGGYLFFASWLVTLYHVYDNRWYHQRREQRERFVSTMRKGLKVRRRKTK